MPCKNIWPTTFFSKRLENDCTSTHYLSIPSPLPHFVSTLYQDHWQTLLSIMPFRLWPYSCQRTSARPMPLLWPLSGKIAKFLGILHLAYSSIILYIIRNQLMNKKPIASDHTFDQQYVRRLRARICLLLSKFWEYEKEGKDMEEGGV